MLLKMMPRSPVSLRGVALVPTRMFVKYTAEYLRLMLTKWVHIFGHLVVRLLLALFEKAHVRHYRKPNIDRPCGSSACR